MMSSGITRDRRLMASLGLVALLSAACAAEAADDPGDGQSGTPAAAAGPGAFAAANYTIDLTGVCPNPVVIQSDWFPQPEHGGMYQLIGSGGTVDKEKGTYRGPLGSTGVDLEIRSGGPYLGNQPNVSVMYQDEDILLGAGSTDMSVQFSKDLPTTAVVAPLEIAPPAFIWDPEQYDFQEIADIGKSDATVLVFDKTASYFQYLVGKGLIRADQLDGSYDGSPSRFVAEEGIVQVGFVTNEIYKYEHEIEEWKKPVDYLLIEESGFRTYQGSLAVRTADLQAQAPCLERLVPLIQQAQVDYITDPAEVNEELIRIVTELGSFWHLSEGGVAAAVQTMRDLEIVSNGPDDTLGNFDQERVNVLLGELLDVYETTGVDTHDPGVTVDDVITNEFIDPAIGLS